MLRAEVGLWLRLQRGTAVLGPSMIWTVARACSNGFGEGHMWVQEARVGEEKLLPARNHLRLDFGDPSCFPASLRPRAAPDSLSQLQILSLVSWGQACLWSDAISKLSSSSVRGLIG